MGNSGFNLEFLKKMFFRTDVIVSSSVVGILLIMILPIPAMLLDYLLAISVSPFASGKLLGGFLHPETTGNLPYSPWGCS